MAEREYNRQGKKETSLDEEKQKARSSHSKNTEPQHFFNQPIEYSSLQQRQKQLKMKTQNNTPANELASQIVLQSQINKVANKQGIPQYKIVRNNHKGDTLEEQQNNGSFKGMLIIQNQSKDNSVYSNNQGDRSDKQQRENNYNMQGPSINSVTNNRQLNSNFYPQMECSGSRSNSSIEKWKVNSVFQSNQGLEDSHGEISAKRIPKLIPSNNELLEEQVSGKKLNNAIDVNYSQKIKQSLSTGQNRLRRNKGARGDIIAIRSNNNTQATDSALFTGGINSVNSGGLQTNQTTILNKSSNISSQAYSNSGIGTVNSLNSQLQKGVISGGRKIIQSNEMSIDQLQKQTQSTAQKDQSQKKILSISPPMKKQIQK